MGIYKGFFMVQWPRIIFCSLLLVGLLHALGCRSGSRSTVDSDEDDGAQSTQVTANPSSDDQTISVTETISVLIPANTFAQAVNLSADQGEVAQFSELTEAQRSRIIPTTVQTVRITDQENNIIENVSGTVTLVLTLDSALINESLALLIQVLNESLAITEHLQFSPDSITDNGDGTMQVRYTIPVYVFFVICVIERETPDEDLSPYEPETPNNPGLDCAPSGSIDCTMDLVVSADNYYSVHIANEMGDSPDFVGQSPNNLWSSSESFADVTFDKDDYFYFVAWNGGFQRGAIFHLVVDEQTLESSLTNTLVTLGPTKGAGNTRITDGALTTALSASPTWYNPAYFSPNDGVNVWGSVVSDLGSAIWIWLDDFNHGDEEANSNSGINTYSGPDSDGDYVIFRSKCKLIDIAAGTSGCT